MPDLHTQRKKPAQKSFPKQDVEDCLRDCLSEVAKDQTAIGTTADPLMPVIDSLVVVEILVAVEPIVGSELSETIVKRGGYRSINEALKDLLPKIERYWSETH